MKHIKTGSFPLVQIDKEDRKCIDSYMIKNLAKLVVLNELVSSGPGNNKILKTPNTVLEQIGFSTKHKEHDDLSSQNNSENVIRSFKAFKELYNHIGKDPFYKNDVLYPIYIEQKSTHANKTSYDYDFLLITNDLQKNQSLDEITYDDYTTLSFIVLKDLLYPDVTLQDLSVKNEKIDTREFRLNFVKFIQHAKSIRKNPIQIFESIIKSVGDTMRDTKNKGMDYTKTDLLNSMRNTMGSTSNTSNTKENNFIKSLFDDFGKLTSASQLIKFTHNQIKEFVNEPNNEKDFNISNRQFNFQKVQDYTQVLQVLDSLIVFNGITINDIFGDVNSSTAVVKIKDDEGNNQFDVDLGELTNDFNTLYYKSFMSHIKDRIDRTLTFINTQRENKEIVKSREVAERYGTSLQRNKDEFTNELKEYQDCINLFQKKPGTLLDKHIINLNNLNNLNDNSYYTGISDNFFSNSIYIDPSKFDENNPISIKEALSSDLDPKITIIEIKNFIERIDRFSPQYITLLINKMKVLQQNSMINQNDIENDEHNTILGMGATKENSTSVKFEFSNLQNSLTYIHRDIIKFIQDEDKLSIFLNNYKDSLKDSTKFRNSTFEDFKNSQLLKELNLSLGELIDDIKSNIINSTTGVVLDEAGKNSLDLFNKDLENYIRNQFTEDVVKKIIKNFSKSKSTYKLEQSSNTSINNNPILRKILTKNGINNLKTFILTEQILIDFYDTTYYFDSLKYQSGLINNMVQKLNNKDNKINRSLIRLGLEDCPVFIIGKGNSIYLKMPNLLSLTNSSFFNKIRINDLKDACNIQGIGKQWDEQLMFNYRERMKKRIEKQAFDKGSSRDVVISELKKLQDLPKNGRELNDRLKKIKRLMNDPKLSKEDRTSYHEEFNSLRKQKNDIDKNQKLIKKYQNQIKNYDDRINDPTNNRDITDQLNRMDGINGIKPNNYSNRY